jgi:cytochrome c peroxidase
MKTVCIAFITGVFLLLAATGCRHSTFGNLFWDNEPDSLYTGKKYTVQRPFKFPAIDNKYADSMTYEGVELGRRLFYDKHLSADGKKSCASCHLLQYALSDSGLAKSVNETGVTKRNTPALQNLLWAKSFFWDGKVSALDAQSKDAAHNELAINADITTSYLKSDSVYERLFKKAFGRPGTITGDKMNKAIQQFMMSIVSCNSKFDRVKKGEEQFTASEQRGLEVFSTDAGGCSRCHNSAGGYTLLLTDGNFKNNGLDSVLTAYQFPDSGRGGVTHKLSDYGKFKVPTLRNVAVTGPYMHDGRYKTLQQVINFYSDSTRFSPTIDPDIVYVFKGKHTHHLTALQKSDLLNFLYTLTDSSFLHNQALADPFTVYR